MCLQECNDPLTNLSKIFDRLLRLDDENKKLKDRIDFLERQDALQRIIINTTFSSTFQRKKNKHSKMLYFIDCNIFILAILLLDFDTF